MDTQADERMDWHMEWASVLTQTVNHIEAHLLEEITLEQIAAQVGISPLYLQKSFQILSGCSPSEYIRSRRLSLAAEEIMSGDAKIIDIAMKYGYDTSESFTKAFTRFHGTSPMQMRKTKASARIFQPFKFNVNLQGGIIMENTNFKVSPMFPFKLIGFVREFTYESGYIEIPKFWDEICEKYATPLYATRQPKNAYEKAIMDNCIGEYGLCIDDLGNGKFRYMIAGRYTGGEVPDGMLVYEVPFFEWAKFKAIGAMPAALQAVNDYVFKQWLPNNPEYDIAAGLNIEWYSCDGDKSDADYESAIWVPVRKK